MANKGIFKANFIIKREKWQKFRKICKNASAAINQFIDERIADSEQGDKNSNNAE